jgi:hypothetical protein
MTYYSRKIEMPKTRKEGLLNAIQLIINAAERGDSREAMLLAVDLKDTIDGNANPWSAITNSVSAEAVAKELVEARKAFEAEKSQAVSRAFEKGQESAKAHFLDLLRPKVAA